MPYITCNPDAPSGPWTATTPCPVCHEARKVRERSGVLRRLLGMSRRPAPASPPSVCSECGTAGSETVIFSEPDWNPERGAGRRAEEPVGPANETRADDAFGPPTPLGRPASKWARLKPLEDHPYFAVPDAHELAWARAVGKAQKRERGASDAWRALRRVAGRFRFAPSRGPALPLTYEERRAISQERRNLAGKLRRAGDGSTSPLILPQSALEPISEEDEPEEEGRPQVRHG